MHDLVTYFLFFFFNDTATTEIYTLSLHDALPISSVLSQKEKEYVEAARMTGEPEFRILFYQILSNRSEEHTSELQSRLHLVCRLLLEKKKQRPRDPRVGESEQSIPAEPVHPFEEA